MDCPTCAQACEHTYDPLQGAHVDYSYACGQLLQWDYPPPLPETLGVYYRCACTVYPSRPAAVWRPLSAHLTVVSEGNILLTDALCISQVTWARCAPAAPSWFLCQPFHSLLSKALHPLVDMATADPDFRGNVGDRHPVSEK
jgi:hypothetical protein